jgi:predicted ATPase/DNA-binding CsgD family transcriptional regulator
LVASSIAQAIGLRDATTGPLDELLLTHLRDKQLLLVLDNFEQVMAATALVVNLLATCNHLKCVVTSRMALRLSGEHEFTVPPLRLPGAEALGVMAELVHYPAIALFVSRAQAVKPDFQLAPANAAVIAQLCQQLDGIPLAIELAAARSKLLPPQALLSRLTGALGTRLTTLTGGARDLPIRQQTLRNAIAWSYDLLQPAEQRLLRRLSSFVGGWTVEMAEAVCADKTPQPQGDRANMASVHAVTLPVDYILEGLSALLDQSLLQRNESPDGEPRFLMLEMIREYALEQLTNNGEAEAIYRQHANAYLALAETAEPALYGAQQEQWLERLEQEHGNLRAALAWSHQVGEYELALRLTLTLGQFWWRHGHMSEARQWADKILALESTIFATTATAGVDAQAQELQTKIASLFYLTGAFAWHQGDARRATTLCTQAVARYRALNDHRNLPRCLRMLALAALSQGAYSQATPLLEESLALCHEVGDQRGLAWSLAFFGRTANGLGDTARAQKLFGESLALFRQLGDKDGLVFQLQYLGDLALTEGDLPQAERLLNDSLRLARQMGHRIGMASTLWSLGVTAIRGGNRIQAFDHLQESLLLHQTLGIRSGVAECYEQLALLACSQGQAPVALRLAQAAEEVRQRDQPAIASHERVALPFGLAALRVRLGGPGFEEADASAQTLSVAQALQRVSDGTQHPQPALPPVESATPRPSAPATKLERAEELTSRELEVLRLIARGLTYAQIAETLFISPRTVDAHLRSIYGKLGINSRHEATRYALDQHLS